MAEKPEVNKSQAIRDYFKSNPKAKTQEVVDALAKHGITVTAGLVNTVKSKHNQRQAAKKAAKTATKTATTSEAKTGDVNKTQAVRDYLKANKKAKAQEVVEALGKQGITITVGYVRTIKAKSKSGGGPSRRSSRMSLPRAASVSPRSRRPLPSSRPWGAWRWRNRPLRRLLEIKKVV